MYLKRLDLHGFKSFASATAFEFSPGVTCIAGPNGSGKTNVAEAIRWVLGEQSSRILRARKTEDIIFSGSAKRPPLGLAEVRITLDNNDGWLPVDFEEVVISRRAHRSGENEYYLNQSRVRLKDLTDLFLKAQVGQNSYAFMGQGLVEQVLTLRPEERRSLIEQAADVRLHRDKLDEARRRLAATHDNLERIDLLVREIEPRLRQLERQAGRAAAHSRLSGELAQALQTLYGRQWQEAQEALAAARAACDQRQEAFDHARHDAEAADEGLAALTTAIEERRSDITQREETYRNLEDYRRDLQRRITADDERRAMLAERREELLAEIESLRGERQESAELVQQRELRARALEEELAAARTPDANVQKLEELTTRLGEVRRELADAETRASQASARLAEAEGRLTVVADQQQRLRADLAEMQDARGERIALLRTWAREFATRRQRVVELAPAVQRSGRTLTDTEARLARASTAVTRRQEEVRRLTVESESAQARLEVTEATDVELPAPDAGVQALLAAGGQVSGQEPPPDSRIHGLVGMLGQLLRVPAGLERAIEAALADSIHAVVVERQEDALAASELLVSEDLGRAIIYPLSDVRITPPINLMKERGVIGVAADLVRCDGRYRSLVNTLLGRTIVTENLGIAKALLRRGLGSVVTLDGILLRPVGSISAGSAKAIRRAFVHQRESSELPQELEQLRAALREATPALESEEQELTEARKAHEALAPELERMRAELAAADAALRQHRARLPATAAQLSALYARRHEAQRLLSDAQGTSTSASAGAERGRAEVEELEATQRRLRGEIEEAASAHQALSQKTADRPSRIAALEAEQAGLQRQAELQSASLARVEGELTRRNDLASRLAEELTTVGGRLEAARQELEEQSAQAEAAREELGPARHSLEQLGSRQRTINDELTTVRSNAIAAERALLDAQATVRLRDEELVALRARLEDEGFQPSSEGQSEGEVAPKEEGDGPPAWLTSEQQGDEELPPMRGGAQVDATVLKERISELRTEIRTLGPVNEQAETDYSDSRERYDFLTSQLTDLREAETSLLEAIDELEAIIKERFSTTFKQVNREFQRYFETFFGGGHAELELTKADEENLPGIEIIAQPPRKRLSTLNMLSGGERSLTAVALLFALLQIHPSPIVVLDEVDAALDDANVARFTGALRELAERSQFIIITHNRRTLEIADTIYGVSMGEDSTSTVLSLRLGEVKTG